MVCAKSVCVLCTLELIPVASHRFRVHDETTIRSATRDDDDPVSKLAIGSLSCPGWSVEQPFGHLHFEIHYPVSDQLVEEVENLDSYVRPKLWITRQVINPFLGNHLHIHTLPVQHKVTHSKKGEKARESIG